MSKYQYTHADVAEYLNEARLPPGPLNRTGRWTGPAVVRYFRNTILFGRPFRNDKITVKNYETGRRRCQKNPEGRIEIDRPDLAFLEPTIEPLLNARFDHYSKTYKRDRGARDPLADVARTKSRFPGQCLRCWYCGREYVWGANGQRDRLMCGGSRQHLCWNSTGVDGATITRAVTAAILTAVEAMPGVAVQLNAMLEQARQHNDGGEKKMLAIEKELADNKMYQKNLASAIARIGEPENEPLLEELKLLQTNGLRIQSELAEVKRTCSAPNLPKDLDEMMLAFREVLMHDTGTYDLAKLLRPMVVSMDTHLVRLIDSVKPIPRTRVVLNLLAQWSDLASVPAAKDVFTTTLTVENESLPQRYRVRERAMQLIGEGFKQREVAHQLRVHQPVIDRASRLTRMMAARDLDTPFVPVMSPDEIGTKHRRHRHHRYRFQPIDGYEPRAL